MKCCNISVTFQVEIHKQIRTNMYWLLYSKISMFAIPQRKKERTFYVFLKQKCHISIVC